MNRAEFHDAHNSWKENHWDMRRRAFARSVRSAWMRDESWQADEGAAMDAPDWLPVGATRGDLMQVTGEVVHVAGVRLRGAA